MGVKQKPTQSTPMNGLSQVLDKDREREKRRRAAETNVGKEFQTVCSLLLLVQLVLICCLD
jgi:histone deacetylase complex subunit SAP30